MVAPHPTSKGRPIVMTRSPIYSVGFGSYIAIYSTKYKPLKQKKRGLLIKPPLFGWAAAPTLDFIVIVKKTFRLLSERTGRFSNTVLKNRQRFPTQLIACPGYVQDITGHVQLAAGFKI
jgi:hypothetical protein